LVLILYCLRGVSNLYDLAFGLWAIYLFWVFILLGYPENNARI